MEFAALDTLQHSLGRASTAAGPEVLYSYLSRLRQALAAVNDVRIDRRSAGYLLTVDPMTIDLHRFHHLLAQARAGGDDQMAAEMLDEALRLWRGPAFATLDTPWLTSVRHALDQQRWAAELDRNDLALRLGRHSVLLVELSAAVTAHPLDERLAGQLLLALYRSGRQADALARTVPRQSRRRVCTPRRRSSLTGGHRPWMARWGRSGGITAARSQRRVSVTPRTGQVTAKVWRALAANAFDAGFTVESGQAPGDGRRSPLGEVEAVGEVAVEAGPQPAAVSSGWSAADHRACWVNARGYLPAPTCAPAAGWGARAAGRCRCIQRNAGLPSWSAADTRWTALRRSQLHAVRDPLYGACGGRRVN